MVQIVRASLIGSILGNLLLVMGLAFVWGGIHHKEQRFSTTAVGANGSLLLLAVITLTMPTAYVFTMQDKGAAAEGVMQLSHAAAIILIGLYGLFLLFQLRTHQELFATEGAHSHEAPQMSQREAIVLLLGATVILGWMAEILVHSIAEGAEELNLSPLFIGAWLVGVDLSFEFGLFETIAVFLSVLIANAIASDGKSNWLEGAMLLGTYAIMAAAFFLH